MRRPLILLTLLVLLTGFLMWRFSAAQVVKRRTNELMEILTLDAASPRASRELGAFKLDRLLAPTIELAVPSMVDLHGSHDRAEISQGYSYLCGSAKETRFHATDLQVAVDGPKATVEATLEVLVNVNGMPSVNESGHATLRWMKSDDGWRLSGAEWKPGK